MQRWRTTRPRNRLFDPVKGCRRKSASGNCPGSKASGRAMSPLKLYPDAPGRKALWIGADVLVIVWLGFWSLLGYYIHQLIEVLQAIPDAIDRAGATLDAPLQRAISAASQIPIVGSLIVDRLQNASNATAGRAHAVAAALSNLIDVAALGMALLVATPPILIVIGFYGYNRWRASREMGSAKKVVEVALREHRGEQLNEALARRAFEVVPYRRLAKVSPDPLGELHSGRYDALAAESLRAAGLSADIARPAPNATDSSMKPGAGRAKPRTE
jgi:hypothetical protein